MIDNLTQQAIEAALNQNWEEAVRLNLKILESNPNDFETYNRLGRGYAELNKPVLAKKAFDQVLKHDPYNQIAQKNLSMINTKKTNGQRKPLDPNLFLEDPGKTKTTVLVELTDKSSICKLSIGDELKLAPKKHTISVINSEGCYLGKLPDDLSQRLLSFINNGNKYQINIKSADKNEIKIFIREIFRAKKLALTPSFPFQEIAYQAFVPPDLVHENRPEIADAEGEEEKTDEDSENRNQETREMEEEE